jgi:hypothetical protein
MKMTDFETRVREAIEHGTDGPAPRDLVGRVRERARSRRRRTTALAAGVSSATVAVVAVAAAQLSGPDPTQRTPSADNSPSSSETVAADPGWRWESWHDVQVQVPADWVYGSRSQWCTTSTRNDGWRVPRVWRTHEPVTKVHCSDPTESYGVTFFPTWAIDIGWERGKIVQIEDGRSGPVGAWYSIILESDVGVRIAAPDRETVEHIIGSADRFRTHPDNNGCFFAAERNFGRVEAEPGTINVCRYMDGFWLQQSERLEGPAADATIAALEEAPVIGRSNCPIGKVPQPVIELVTAEGVAQVWVGTWCQGVYWDRRLRELTPELMYWALSPGYAGGLPSDVPLPESLRS